MSACADTKYKSVFVMSEEKDECIIATEVSFFFVCLTFQCNQTVFGHLGNEIQQTNVLFCLSLSLQV